MNYSVGEATPAVGSDTGYGALRGTRMVQLEVKAWSSWEDRDEGGRGTERTILQ